MSIVFNSTHGYVSRDGYSLVHTSREYSKENVFIKDENQLMDLLKEKFGNSKKIDSLNYEFKDYLIKIVPYDNSLKDKCSGFVTVYNADGMFKFSAYIPRTYIEYQNLVNAIDYIFKFNPSLPYSVMEIFYPESYSADVNKAIFYKSGLTFALTYESMNDGSYIYTFRSQQARHNFFKSKDLFDLESTLNHLYLNDEQCIDKRIIELFPNKLLDVLIHFDGNVDYAYSNKFISINIRSIGSEYNLFIDGNIVDGQIKSIDELKQSIDRYIGSLQTKIDQLNWLMK